MRHLNKKSKLGRKASHRKALLNNLFTSLLAHGRIKTTEVRGKALVSFANYLIEKAKKGDLVSRRKVSSHITNKEVSVNFFKDTLPKVASRKGGHIRLLRVGLRKGDDASVVLVELITDELKKAELKKEVSKKETHPKAESIKTEPKKEISKKEEPIKEESKKKDNAVPDQKP